MAETVEQYKKRILDHVGRGDPLNLQAAAPKRVAQLMRGVSMAKLRKRPSPEKWSVAEIVAHLAEAELVVGYRLRTTLGAPGTAIQAYYPDAGAASGHYAKRDPRRSLAEYRAMREANLALLKLITPEQWKHFGVH